MGGYKYTLLQPQKLFQFQYCPSITLYHNSLNTAQWTYWTIRKQHNNILKHMAEISEDGTVHICLCSTYLGQTHSQKKRSMESISEEFSWNGSQLKSVKFYCLSFHKTSDSVQSVVSEIAEPLPFQVWRANVSKVLHKNESTLKSKGRSIRCVKSQIIRIYIIPFGSGERLQTTVKCEITQTGHE